MDLMSKAECAAYAATHSSTRTLSEYDGGPYGCWKHEESGSPNNGKVYWRDVGTGNGPNCDGLRPCYCKPKPSETPDCAAGIRRCACSTSCSASAAPVAVSGDTSYAAVRVMPFLEAARSVINSQIKAQLSPGGFAESLLWMGPHLPRRGLLQWRHRQGGGLHCREVRKTLLRHGQLQRILVPRRPDGTVPAVDEWMRVTHDEQLALEGLCHRGQASRLQRWHGVGLPN